MRHATNSMHVKMASSLLLLVREGIECPMNSAQGQPAGINLSVDLSTALYWVNGDRALLAEITKIFLEDCPRRLHELEQAVKESNAIGVSRAAHSLKGMVACFGARPAQELAGEMEGLGKAGYLAKTSDLLPALLLEFARVMNHLKMADWQGIN